MPTTCSAELTEIPHAVLLERCRIEMARYRHGEPHDDRSALELFRHAVVERNDQAWEALHGMYHDLVVGWCQRAGAVDPDEAAHGAWVKFWQHYTPAKLHAAAGLPAVLSYLKLCARSVVLDSVRSRGAVCGSHEDTDLVDPHPAPEEQRADADDRSALWRLVREHLRDDRERAVIGLTYGLGLTSAEVHARRPDLFPSVRDVYKATRNVLDRLRRSRAMREWFEAA
jgi:DNA-directed RNA polymerase specialized sigma24 family protein